MPTRVKTVHAVVAVLSPYLKVIWRSHLSHRSWRALYVALGLMAILIRPYFVVPRNLRHLPKVSTVEWFLSVLRGESSDVRSERLVLPLIQKHGLCLKYMIGRWTVTVGDPVLLQAMLKDVETFPKAQHINLDPDLILTNKEANMGNANNLDWRRQRRVANPIFHRALPVETFGQIASRMFAAMVAYGNNGIIDAADFMKRYALDCLGLGVFDFDMGAVSDPSSPYAVLYKDAFNILRDPLVYLFPAYTSIPSRYIPYRNKSRLANDELRRILYDIVEEKKRSLEHNQIPDQKKDLLTLMIEASKAENEDKYLTNGELVANLSVFFVAGHETTASATASTLYYLAAHPEIQERARSEVISVLGDDPEDILPTQEQLRKMPYLNNCIKEAMRINPPTSGNLPRLCVRDTYLGNHFIPKGTTLAMELYSLHHLPKYWKDPDTYNPDRFIQIDNNYWMPFGYGPRACIGMNFSLAEQRVVQAMMLRKFTWKLAPNSEHADGLKNAKSGGITLLGPLQLHLQLTKRY